MKNDPDYWAKLLGDIVGDDTLNEVTSEFGKGKRVRKQITYYDIDLKDISGDSDSSFHSETEESSEGEAEFEKETLNMEQISEPHPQMVKYSDKGENLGNKQNVSSKNLELKWKTLNSRTIKVINMSLFRFGLPPVSFTELKNKW